MSQPPEHPGKSLAHRDWRPRPVTITPTPEMKEALKPSRVQIWLSCLNVGSALLLVGFAWQQSENNTKIGDVIDEAKGLVNSQTDVIKTFGEHVTGSREVFEAQMKDFGMQVQGSQTQFQKQMETFSIEVQELGDGFRAAVSKLVEHSETQEQRAINKEIRELILEAEKTASACSEDDVSVRFFLEEVVRLERRLATSEQRLTPSQYFKLVYLGYGFLDTQELLRYCDYDIDDSATPLAKHSANLLAAHVCFRRHELGRESTADMIEKARSYFKDAVEILQAEEMTADNHYFIGRAYQLWAAHELYTESRGTGLEDAANVASEKSRQAHEHFSKTDAELSAEFCQDLAYTLKRSKQGQAPKAPCMLDFTRVPGFEYSPEPLPGVGSLPPGLQPTPAPPPVAPAPPGFPSPEESVEGKVVIENRTTRSVQLCLNGLYYVLLPGRKEIWATYGPITAYLPRHESPKEYGLVDWKWNRDHYELLLTILSAKDFENR